MPNIKPNEKVRAAMISAGYTQDALAKAIGLSYSALNLKLSGKREFTLPECIRIAKKVDRTLDELFYADNVPN